MTRCLLRVLLLYLVLLAAWAENDDKFAEEQDEKLSNASLEMKDKMGLDSDEIIREQMRAVIIPITANITVATDDNVHSLGLVLGPDGVSVSHSKTFNYPNGENGSTITGSRSSTFAAGLDGLSGARADVLDSQDENGKPKTNAEINSFSRGEASSDTFAGVKDGLPATGAGSSIGAIKSQTSAGLESHTLPSDSSHNEQDKISGESRNNGESNVLVDESLDATTRQGHNTDSMNGSFNPKAEQIQGSMLNGRNELSIRIDSYPHCFMRNPR